MTENLSIEKHIFKLLPPSNWNDSGVTTVTLLDYLINVNAPLIDFSQFLSPSMCIVNDDVTKYDYGQTYFVITGSREDAERHMKLFSDRFESYLKKFSKNGEYKLIYQFFK